MHNHEWPANDYAIGSYIQSTVADHYLHLLKLKPSAEVLDVGCGDGSYTTRIVKNVPKGTVLGIDRSANMLRLAQKKMTDYPNFSVQQADVLAMNFDEQFDAVVSFWCLQWCPDHAKAYKKIYDSLKEGGTVFTVIPTGDDPLMTSYYTVKASGQFPSLDNFIPPIDYKQVAELPHILKTLPFKKMEITTPKQSILLPSLDVFRRFVNGLAFFYDQVPDEEIDAINEALVRAYDLECQANYNGEYRFNFSVYLVIGEK